jgi:hypothetical protein
MNDGQFSGGRVRGCVQINLKLTRSIVIYASAAQSKKTLSE